MSNSKILKYLEKTIKLREFKGGAPTPVTLSIDNRPDPNKHFYIKFNYEALASNPYMYNITDFEIKLENRVLDLPLNKFIINTMLFDAFFNVEGNIGVIKSLFEKSATRAERVAHVMAGVNYMRSKKQAEDNGQEIPPMPDAINGFILVEKDKIENINKCEETQIANIYLTNNPAQTLGELKLFVESYFRKNQCFNIYSNPDYRTILINYPLLSLVYITSCITTNYFKVTLPSDAGDPVDQATKDEFLKFIPKYIDAAIDNRDIQFNIFTGMIPDPAAADPAAGGAGGEVAQIPNFLMRSPTQQYKIIFDSGNAGNTLVTTRFLQELGYLNPDNSPKDELINVKIFPGFIQSSVGVVAGAQTKQLTNIVKIDYKFVNPKLNMDKVFSIWAFVSDSPIYDILYGQDDMKILYENGYSIKWHHSKLKSQALDSLEASKNLYIPGSVNEYEELYNDLIDPTPIRLKNGIFGSIISLKDILANIVKLMNASNLTKLYFNENDIYTYKTEIRRLLEYSQNLQYRFPAVVANPNDPRFADAIFNPARIPDRNRIRDLILFYKEFPNHIRIYLDGHGINYNAFLSFFGLPLVAGPRPKVEFVPAGDARITRYQRLITDIDAKVQMIVNIIAGIPAPAP